MAPPPRLVLASASPRRRELLAKAGLSFAVEVAGIDERPRSGEPAPGLVERLAREKALAVARRVGSEPPRWVLGADTVVVLGEEVLGKPSDLEHAARLLARLSGRSHRVLTGVALAASDTLVTRVQVVESRVAMWPLDEAAIRAYVAEGESLDKAGAYAAQGQGRRLIEHIEGSQSNVIGLPMDETLALLEGIGITP